MPRGALTEAKGIAAGDARPADRGAPGRDDRASPAGTAAAPAAAARPSGSSARSSPARRPPPSTGGARPATSTSSCARRNGRRPTRSGCGPTCRRRWTSARALPPVTKRDRAIVLTLALAELLSPSPASASAFSARPTRSLRGTPPSASPPLLPARRRKPGARPTRARSGASPMSSCSATSSTRSTRLEQTLDAILRAGARAHLVQVLDPIEETFPYAGRTEFRDPETGARHVVVARRAVPRRLPEPPGRAPRAPHARSAGGSTGRSCPPHRPAGDRAAAGAPRPPRRPPEQPRPCHAGRAA